MKDLVEIDIKNFYAGMYVNSSVFYNYNNTLVEILQNTEITPFILIKLLKTSNIYGDLYVNKSNYKEILKESIKTKSLKFDEPNNNSLKNKDFCLEKVKFITRETEIAYDILSKTDTLPYDIFENISQEICNDIINIDTYILLQYMNEIRDFDEYLYTHSVNVAILNGLFGSWIELDKKDVNNLVTIGLLHDLGKTKVPVKILKKIGKLTSDEFEIVKKHPVESYNLLIKAGVKNKDILTGIYSHHEKINGLGYPEGLKLDQIPFFARITAISDIFDAMISNNSYKIGKSPFEALAEFSNSRFSHLDLYLINIFINKMNDELIHKKVKLSDGSIGIIEYMCPSNLAYPLVKTKDKLFKTDDNLKCISII